MGSKRRAYGVLAAMTAFITASVGSVGAGTDDSGPDPTAPTPSTSTPATDESVELPGLGDAVDDALPFDPEVRTGTLDNGLTYSVRQNDRPGGSAEMRLVIDAGSVDEFGEHSGVAHFVEHMLFNGTEAYPENELIDVLGSFGSEFGADINAYTSFDETVYQLTVPSRPDSLDAGLDVLDQWLSHATLDPGQVDAERGVITDEWRQRTQTSQGRLGDVAQAMYLADTAYADRAPIGDPASISDVTADELRAFYDAWYRPDNAAIVVVGDIDVDDVAADIESRFADATPRTDVEPSRPETAVALMPEPAAAIHLDPTQTTVDVEVTLPLPAIEATGTLLWRARLLDQMIFSILIRRLDDDITTGAAPFDSIAPGTNSMVRGLDAPALYAYTDADRAMATVQSLLDEYERARQFGFEATEIDRARREIQASIDGAVQTVDGEQDAPVADALAEQFLSGEPATPITLLEPYLTAILDDVSPDLLAERFVARWDHSAPHVIVAAPASAAGLPTEDEILAAVAQSGDRAVEARNQADAAPAELMAPPEPIAATSDEPLDDIGPFQPFRLSFANGLTVIAAPSDIAAGQVEFSAVSPGGLSVVDDADVVDAAFVGEIVLESGVADLSATEFDSVMAGRNVGVEAWISPYTSNWWGRSTTDDLDSLFQLLHLYSTEPNLDPVALTRTQRRVQPVVDNPASDQALAAATTLSALRYGPDARYATIPSAEQFASLDLDGVGRVWDERFADPSGWTFVFAGDFDPVVLRELAARYLGTIPAGDGPDVVGELEPEPTEGLDVSTIQAGDGDVAMAQWQFVTPAEVFDGRHEATARIAANVIDARLRTVVREELGESYSPYATVVSDFDPDPVVSIAVTVTGDPERITDVADIVNGELADLAADGPTEHEFTEAQAQIGEAAAYADNEDLLTAMTDVALHGENSTSFVDVFDAIPMIGIEDVAEFLDQRLPTDDYDEVIVLPR